MTYPSSIEYVEQDDKNDGEDEKEDCKAKQTCTTPVQHLIHAITDQH